MASGPIAPTFSMSDFRKLRVWQAAQTLVIDAYRVTRLMRGPQSANLSDQLNRAVMSVPRNIVDVRKMLHGLLKSINGKEPGLRNRASVTTQRVPFDEQSKSRMKITCGALLFDLDGVLVDSRECVENTWRAWASKHGLNAQAVIDAAHGRRTIDTVGVVAPHLDGEVEVAGLEASESVTTDGVYEIAGARELLESLPAKRWAIVTSGTRPVATLRIRHTGLPMPDVLVCADEIRRGKPDPDGYLVAAQRLGVAPEECIVVEDTPTGLMSAGAAGMRSIAIAGTYPASQLSMADLRLAQLSELRVSPNANGSRLSVSVT